MRGRKGKLNNIEDRITELERKIADVKKRWPFHSVKPAQVQELEELEIELEDLQKQRRLQDKSR